MYIIDLQKIKTGDIILSRSYSEESRRIRENSKSNYSHAIFYVGASSCLESDGLGVHSQNIQRILFENIDDAIVLRLSKEESRDIISEAIVFARQQIGKEYSPREAIRASDKLDIKAIEKNRQFCTRFVAQAFELAGLQIVKNSDYCTPQDLLESKHLIVIESTLNQATEADIKLSNDADNILIHQRNITNTLLEGARNYSGEDIQTLEQLTKFVIHNPEKESSIIRIVEKSGYLNIWELEKINNPWLYDYDLFLNFFSNVSDRLSMGLFLATSSDYDLERFTINLATFEQLNSIKSMKYFQIQIALYETLIDLVNTRREIGLKVLREFHLL